MGLDTVQFVDSITAVPTVRLNLNNESPWAVTGVDFSPPPLKQAWAGTLLADGERLTAAAYANRRLRLSLELITTSQDAAGVALQALWRELDRPSNLLRYQPDGATKPVFFRTLRSMDNSLRDYPGGNGSLRTVEVEIVAEPFALGLRETLPAVTVYNDPAEGTELNTNPYFETDPAVVSDAFTRTVSNGWGPSDTGQVWTTSGGSASDSSVLGGVGRTSHGTVGVLRYSLIDAGVTDQTVTTEFVVPVVPTGTGGGITYWTVARTSDTANYYTARLVIAPTTGAAVLDLSKRVAGTLTALTNVGVGTHAAGNMWRVVLDAKGTTVQAKAWRPGTDPEPGWQVTATDSALTSGTLAGVVSRLESGNTNTLPVVITTDTLTVTVPPAGWTAAGGTFVRSTAQFHEGVASGLLTPNGISATTELYSEDVPVSVASSYRVSAWVRCAAARNVQIFTVWFNSVGGFVSSSSATTAVAATTWTLLNHTATAPVGAAWARLGIVMDSTPLASHLLYVDEARLRQVGGVGGMCFDVTSPKGDVESPLYLSVGPNVVASRLVGARQSLIAVRRRGTPSAAPFALQAEAMTVGTDTTVQANNTAFSGAGSNWTRTTFATDATMATRLQASVFPAAAGVDVRGTYRVFMRYRQSAQLGSPMRARLQWGASNGAAPLINGDAVDLVQNDAGSVGPLVKYADLGLVQFPADYDPGYDGPSGVELGAEGVYFAVQAERTSGSTSLDVDLLLLAPADDRQLFVHWPTAAVPPADLVVDSDAAAVYARNASGQVVTLPHPYLSGGTPMVSPGVTNRVYFLQDVGVESSTTDTNSAGDSISATTSITPYYWPRYLYTRPLAG